MSSDTKEWIIDVSEIEAHLGRAVTGQNIQDAFSRLGGAVDVTAKNADVSVSWRPASGSGLPLDEVITWLEHGDYPDAMLVLEVLLSESPEDPAILYNLGMAHSDQGNLERAASLLHAAVAEQPTMTNARVALGVAQLRLGRDDDAIATLTDALQQDEDNPWAHRNVGAAHLRQGNFIVALRHLRRATEIAPHDPQAWYGLAQALEKTDSLEDADEAYVRVIDLTPHSDVAEAAREARSRIAQAAFRESGGGTERMDAVMYCLDAMEKFDTMGTERMGRVVMEIALLGRRGLDVNDPVRKYELRSLAGKFSGLQLVSMLYVGYKRLRPEHEVGFDLSTEFKAALSLREAKA